jgi:multidrug efflux pump subunit AcrA (membrane-fusion protein)
MYGVGAMTKPGVWRPNYMREIPVRLKLERIDARVIPDLSASADVLLAREEHAVITPLSAVFHDAGTSPFVFLRTSGGWQRREIELGLTNHVAAAVRSGLATGEVVAIERPASVKPPL